MLDKKISKKDNKKYKALIIGAGKIAALFDNPKSAEIITHAHAYKNNNKISSLGFFDVDKKATVLASKLWGAKAFSSWKDVVDYEPDIISVCTPDGSHYSVLEKIVSLQPKVVICEKPLTNDINDSRKILKMYDTAGIPVIINYSRRFDLTIQKIKADIENGKFGKVLCGRAIYGKGLIHNGSHIIDLCHYLFGSVVYAQANYSISDYENNKDRNVSAFLKFKNCPQFHLAVGDERKFSIFEFDILLEKRRYVLFDSGICYVSTSNVEKDPLYSGYRCLGKSKIEKTQIGIATVQLVDNAVKVVEHRAKPICNMQDAYEAQKVCVDLLNNCLNNKICLS